MLLLACARPPAETADAPPALTPAARATRVSLDVRGVRPTPEELDAVEADDAALDGLVDTWLADPRFEARVRDLYQEVYLTRADSFPVDPSDYGITDAAGYARSIGEEPLRILGRVAAADRPWTDIVTADWTMADETLASMWPLDYPEGASGWSEARYTDGRPAAGVLATNGLWWRYISTTSNGNRKRANFISKALLCNDYLVREITFDRNVNLLDEAAVSDALRTQPGCVACHVSLDPVASYLFGFSWFNWKNAGEASYYFPDREEEWREHTGVPPSWFGQPGWSLADLGPQIAADDRFVSCAVEQVYGLLLRRAPTVDDTDALVRHREAFLASGLRLRALFRSVVDDPRYLAPDEAEADALVGAVPAKLATADLLATQIEGLTGFAWTREGWDLMRSDVYGYRTLAGGADGYTVQATAKGPNATLILVQERLAEAAAWHAVYVEPTVLFGADAVDTNAHTDAATAAATLQRLHRRVFGEQLATDDPALAEELALWEELYALDADERAAWAGVVSVLLRDPRLLVY